MDMEAVMNPDFTITRCACGCGRQVRNSFAKGHARKGVPMTEEHKMKISRALTGRQMSEDARKKLMGRKHSAETREKLRQIATGKTHIFSEAGKEKLRQKRKLQIFSEETKQKISIAGKGRIPWNRGIPMPDVTKAKRRKLWTDPIFVQKVLSGGKKSPNKPERTLLQILEDLYPGEWRFVGDGRIIIDGRCPDFINCNGQKKIIELFGDYWHRHDDPLARIERFKAFGYDTLIIWERELKSLGPLLSKLQSFNQHGEAV
jgi:hypothetical protein